MPRRLPSPALIVASLALAVALGGTTYAATALPKNSVGAKQLKSGAVSSVKLAKGSVTSKQIKDHTIVAADLAKNVFPALGAGGKVANAGHADTADHASVADSVAGAHYTTVDYRVGPGTGATPIVAANGLTLAASCDDGGTLLLSLASASGDAQYALLATDDTGNVRGDSFNAWTGDAFDIASRLGLPDLTRETLHLTYQNPGGQPVVVDIAIDSAAFNGATPCYVGGYAIS